MKINFLAPHLRIAGGTRIFLEYASRLALRGHDVTVYVRSNNRFRRAMANIFQLGGPNWVANFHARVVRVPSFTDASIRDADVLVATTYDNALLVQDFLPKKGKQFYMLQHDEGLYHGDRALADRAYRLNQKKIVVATWLKELMADQYAQEAVLLLNPIDKAQFHQIPRTTGDAVVRILVLAHTYEWKGTREAVGMVNQLKKKYPQVRLMLYGVRTPDAQDYECDEYHYNVPQNELKQLYSNSDIYLCSSWDEGFGLPSVEAMACGAAVATYDNGGSRDFAFHEKTALVAPRRDEAALARELERLVADKDLRNRIAREGKKYVEGMPTWEEQTAALEQILLAHT